MAEAASPRIAFKRAYPPHGYSLRRRPVTNLPLSSRRESFPVLPADVPRRDEDGNWLIYLYEESTPEAVDNARYAVGIGHPWILTYDPNGNQRARRSQSTGQYQSQKELLNLTPEELKGGSGTGQLDRDEYPPAIAAEGGAGAAVAYIESGDNRRAGSLMGQQFRNYKMKEGDKFRYAFIDRSMTGVDYLGDGLVADA